MSRELRLETTEAAQNLPIPIDNKVYTRSQYTIGIICKLPGELKAIRALFDKNHPTLLNAQGDDNAYALGEMAGHRVVATCFGAGEHEASEAALTATDMKSSYPSIRFCLFVGTAGGVHSKEKDIHLGDVVIGLSIRPWGSDPEDTRPGVLQYELGEEGNDNRFQLKASMLQPFTLKYAIQMLSSDPEADIQLDRYIRAITDRLPEYKYPGQDLDVPPQDSCVAYPSHRWYRKLFSRTQQRVPHTTTTPKIHHGLIASGDRLIEDAAFRNQIAQEHGILCFDIGAASMINEVDCLVIRGIRDYGDARNDDFWAQNDDIWQKYAAATAAAYAKLLLSNVAGEEEEN